MNGQQDHDHTWMLISGHFDGSLSADERKALNTLLTEDDKAADLFAQTARMHDKLHTHAKDNQAAIGEIIELPRRGKQRAILSLAAAILACLIGAYLLFSEQNHNTPQLRIEVLRGHVDVDGTRIQGIATVGAKQLIQTHAHATTLLHLGDGSEIEVLAETQVQITKPHQLMLLHGAVRCQIKKSSTHANTQFQAEHARFVVQTENAKIHVVGTTFTVRHLESTQVTVSEGIVAVETAQAPELIYLKQNDMLSVNKQFLVSSASSNTKMRTVWQLDFENGTHAESYIGGELIKTETAPRGNQSNYCFQATLNGQPDKNLLQAIFKNKDDVWFNAHDDAWISFKYWANQSCGWLGVWMASAPEHHYLHYHREFVPLTDRWVEARIRLRDCVRGNGPDAIETLAMGAPVHWFMIQSGHLPGARLYVDDIRIEVPINK